MEDLAPLLIFIVIAVVNILKYAAEKGGKKKPAQPDGSAPERAPSSLEDFFAKLAEQVEPQPTELPDWPEDHERPDYLAEMDEYQHAQTVDIKPVETMQVHPQEPVYTPTVEPRPQNAIITVQTSTAPKLSIKSTPAIASSTNGLRMTMAPILRSSSAGKINFSLQTKQKLKQAMIANLVFSPPRAYDRSFDTTMAK